MTQTMDDLIQEILRLAEEGQRCVLATILTHDGSTPRTAGARMVIRPDGSIFGTIGGGRLEAEVMAAAPALLATGQDRMVAFDLGATETAESMDMICGGRMTVLMERIGKDAGLPDFNALSQGLKAGTKGWLVRRIVSGEGAGCRVERFWLSDKAPLPPELSLPPALTDALGRERRSSRGPVHLDIAGEAFWAEPVCVPATLLILGAGHVSLQVANLAGQVDFRTVVMDDREDFANRQRFPLADEVRVIADFDFALDGVDVTADSFVVIVTRGHHHDQTVLAQALKTPAGYIGMIGSRKKRDTIYRNLRAEGFSDDDLARVHSPIGLAIGAETPEEIAVSIVAELIAVRAEKERHRPKFVT
ncbi:MAG: XdhC family protein [Desulfobacterales bacterium]|nr:XdhC family protein [Desulfobacterales bacterium]